MWHRFKIVSYAETGSVCRGGKHPETEGQRAAKGEGSVRSIGTRLPRLFWSGTKHQKLLFIWRIGLLRMFLPHFQTGSAAMAAPAQLTAPWCSEGAVENAASAFRCSPAPCSWAISVPLVPPQPHRSSAHRSAVCCVCVRLSAWVL